MQRRRGKQTNSLQPSNKTENEKNCLEVESKHWVRDKRKQTICRQKHYKFHTTSEMRLRSQDNRIIH